MSLTELGKLERTPTILTIRRFLRHTARLAATTRRRYRDTLWRFSAQMPDFIEQITPEHIDRYLFSRKLSNNSKNTELTPIKSFFNFLETYYDIPNVAKRVKYLRFQPFKQRVFSCEEVRKILAVANPKERAMLTFLLNTGVRVSEFCSITPNAISPDNKYMTITGKGSRQRVVPLNAAAREALPLIFAQKYTRDSVSWIFKKLCKRAGIPLAYPHACRHYFVTTMIRKGVSRTIVAKIVGMSENVLEKVYCHLLTSDLVGTTDVLEAGL